VKLEVSQQSYTQGRFRVYQRLTDLNSDRPQTEDAKALRYNREIFVYDILTQICQGKCRDFSREWTLYNLSSYLSNFSHALKIWQKDLTEYRDIGIYFGGFVESELK